MADLKISELSFRYARRNEFSRAREMMLETASANLRFAVSPPRTAEQVRFEVDEVWSDCYEPWAAKGLIRFLFAIYQREPVALSVFGPRNPNRRETPGFIFAFGVKSGMRGLGIGKTLLAESLRRLKSLGYQQAALALYIDNFAAKKLYQGAGFKAEQMTMVYDLNDLV